MLRQPSAAPHWRVLKPTKCAAQSPIAHKRIAAGTDHSSRVAGINRLVHGNKRRWHSNHLPLQRSWSVRAALSGIRCWPMRHAACGRMLQRVSRLSLRLKVKDCQALSDKYVKPRARCMRGRPAIIPVHTAAVETVGWPFRANLFSRRGLNHLPDKGQEQWRLSEAQTGTPPLRRAETSAGSCFCAAAGCDAQS